MTAAPTIRQLGDRLDEAYCAFLDGERDGDAFVAAYDYREDGYELAEKAVWLSADGRDAFLEAALDKADAGATRDLIAAAFAFRVAELSAQPMERAAA